MENRLSTAQAYQAMYAFLERYFQLTDAEEIGALLGGISTLNDGGAADPAAWGDWLEAVRKVQAGEVDTSLKIVE